MIVSSNTLVNDVTKGVERLYFLHGEEELLIEEAYESLSVGAREQGYSEIVHLHLDDFSWNEVLIEFQSSSLFAEKRIIDVRLSKKGYDKAAQEAVNGYLQRPVEDHVVIIRGAKYDRKDASKGWYKELAKNAVVVEIQSIRARELMGWIAARAKGMELNLTQEGVEMLADCCEDNLMAAHQELQRLQLLNISGSNPIGPDEITLLDSSSGNVFELIDCACTGNVARCLKIAKVLQREKVQALSVLNLLGRQLRLAHAESIGAKSNLPAWRREKVQAVARRHSKNEIEALLQECAMIDAQTKGMYRGDPWVSIECLLMALAGQFTSNLVTNRDWLRIDYEKER